MQLEHLKDTKTITREYLEKDIFPACDFLRCNPLNGQQLKGKTLFSLFYEPSFLTRISFERAITMLGGHPLHTEDASQFFPVTTANYIEDTVEILHSLHIDGVVIRSSERGIIENASKASSIPVINGGSNDDHPTQAIADIYTIHRELGSVDNKIVSILGRLEHRNVCALLLGLSLFNNTEVRLLPFSGQVPPETEKACKERGLNLSYLQELSGIKGSDVVYLNGPRTMAHYELLKSRNSFISKIDSKFVSMLKSDSIILDPMQRSGDFSIEIKDSRLAFYRQSENALFARMAVLNKLLG
ncbi:MAG: hypothetical protein CL749_03500 [Chloroflexi bacterium]|jgi:aspartate carbamoyltransferase catalytic subunit|nr:hypothetical protein [Chloroflexota bacterium]MQG02175.1 hypothetical protein [SAR202 cluster bacterium]HAE32221.1 hypothetical protein [Dehalococcoidia bacterium]|tara:strand:+ start:256 stop:1155 length:900 start_codon:yes stop_codon:yes gene_type:complete